LGRKLEWYDLRVDPPPGEKPLPRLRPLYQYHEVTGDIRNGSSRHLLQTIVGDASVFVRVELEGGLRTKAQKKLLVAIAAHGWPPYSPPCQGCGERIPYMAAQLNGQITDTSPGNLKWVPDMDAEVRHRALCMEALVREDPYRPYRRRHAICFCADELSDYEIYELKR
jgi:hypothetical protein